MIGEHVADAAVIPSAPIPSAPPAREVYCLGEADTVTRTGPLIAHEAIQSQQQHQYLFGMKESAVLRRQVLFFILSVIASAMVLTVQGYDGYPAPLVALFSPMRFLKNPPSEPTSYAEFVEQHVNGFLVVALASLLSWLGYQGMYSYPNTKLTLEAFKGIMTAWCVFALVGVFLTCYLWTFVPIFQELLPRCDAEAVCLRGDVEATAAQACIQGHMDASPRLPDECAWIQNDFLSCSPELGQSDTMNFNTLETESHDFNAIVIMSRRLARVDDPVSSRLLKKCALNVHLIQEYHLLVDNFAIVLARATLCLWTLSFVFVLNALSSSSCIFSACKFQQQFLRRAKKGKRAIEACDNSAVIVVAETNVTEELAAADV